MKILKKNIEFMIGLGLIYIAATFYIIFFVRELKHVKLSKEEQEDECNYEDNLTVIGTYKLIWSIIKLKPMIYLILILLTFRVSIL